MSVDEQAVTIPEFGLYHRLQLSLEKVGIGVQDMADFLDMSRGSVGRWLNGHAKPPRVVLMVWADATGVPYEWLEKGLTPAVQPGSDGECAARDSNPEPASNPEALVRLMFRDAWELVA